MTRTCGLWKNLVSIVAALALAIALVPATAFAADSSSEIPAEGVSGDCGGCIWTLTADGKLVINVKDNDTGTLQQFGYMVNLPWNAYISKITSASFGPGVKAESSLGSLFSGYPELASVDLSNLGTSKVTDVSYMFSQSPKLKTVNLGSINTENVNYMGGMFQGCSSLVSMDLSNLNLRSVMDMGSMFYNCTNLSSVTIKGSGTPGLASTGTMFRGCESLAKLDLSGLSTVKANGMYDMFGDCPSLNEVTLSSNFSFYGNGATGAVLTTLPEGKWFSTDLQNDFTAQQIAENWGTTWTAASDTFTRNLNKIDIANANIALSATSFTYDGNAHTPDATVTYEGSTLVKGTDYTVECTNNINAGTATLTIKGMGNYDKEKTATFEIKPASIANATVSIADQTYTGSALTPTATVKMGDVFLAKDTDYTIAYADNTNIGTAKVTITGVGNYTGAKEASFKIDAIPVSGFWVSSGGKWWYSYDEATKAATGKEYPASQWVDISGEKYYFDEAGWMMTGWQKINEAWYYLKSSGAMATGWLNDRGSWYYLDPSSGKMQTGWQKVNDVWHYLNPDNGDMKIGWLNDGGTWYYLNSTGAMATGWLNDRGTWYYLKGSGAMVTGWKRVNGSWYYLDPTNGDMKTGWLNDDGTWYYLQPSGAMVSNGWVSNYWLQKDGSMATDAWVDGDRYYVDATGLWVPGKTR